MKYIYYDNAATTKMDPTCLDEMKLCQEIYFGNPSSDHDLGIQADEKLNEARTDVLSLFSGSYDCTFTSGGTEANNLAILSVSMRYGKKHKHMITSCVEHPSVLKTFRYLETKGYELSCLPVDGLGRIPLEALQKAVREDTFLVSIGHVNGETGTVQDLKKIGALLRERKQPIFFHSDCVQSFGKIPIKASTWNLDAFSISAHKIHGPKGMGALIHQKDISLPAIFHGGEQEKSLRPGTENLCSALAFAKVAKMQADQMKENYENMVRLNEFLVDEMSILIPGLEINGDPWGSPYILNIYLPSISAERLMNLFNAQGIYVSKGSACTARIKKDSHILKGMHLSDERIRSSLRFSFSAHNDLEEAKDFLMRFKKIIQQEKITSLEPELRDKKNVRREIHGKNNLN